MFQKKRRLFAFFGLLMVFLYWSLSIQSKLFQDPKSTVLFSREGKLLGAKIATDGQWRFPHSDTIPHKFKTALLEFEDHNFYQHYGFSPSAIFRAIKQNIKEGRIVSGASTLSMQTIRLAEKNKNRTFITKLFEIIKATRLESKYTKGEILSFYASNAPMGGNVVGLEAASWRYFGRSAENLSWAESALLAVLPNAPGLIHPGRNRKELLEKRNRLLKRLFISNKIDQQDYELSLEEQIPDEPLPIPQLATHLLSRVKKETQLKSSIYFDYQVKINELLSYFNYEYHKREIHNLSVVVIDIETGEIVSYVGNTKDEKNAYNNYVDVAASPRSTGSILKPFLYANMLNDGSLTPSMLVNDIPFFSNNYAPQNYDKKFRGAVHAEWALARSLNVPAVQLLKDHGVPKFKHQLNSMGFSTVTRSPENYGLTLILGGAEARLDELTAAYAAMGNKLLNYSKGMDESYIVGFGNQSHSKEYTSKLSAASIYYTFDALLKVSRPDEESNWETFASSQKIAWKTGTSFGFKDAWAIGVSSKYAVGVWVGNADGEGRPGIVGVEAAAPVLFRVFDILPKSNWFDFPFDDVVKVDICQQSGQLAGQFCDVVDSVFIPKTSLNTEVCKYHQLIHVNSLGKRVNVKCSPYDIHRQKWFVLPPIVERYYKSSHPNYKSLPLYDVGCVDNVSEKRLEVIYPKQNQRLFLPKLFEGEQAKFILEAVNNKAAENIFWHIDDVFVTQTSGEHKIDVTLSEGEHKLTLLNDLGEETSISFVITQP